MIELKNKYEPLLEEDKKEGVIRYNIASNSDALFSQNGKSYKRIFELDEDKPEEIRFYINKSFFDQKGGEDFNASLIADDIVRRLAAVYKSYKIITLPNKENYELHIKFDNPIKTKEDIQNSKKGINVILGIEGGEAVGTDITKVEKLYKQGVRLITLTWNNPYVISDTNCNSAECLNGESGYKGGLTNFGKSVVKEMNRLGMVIDVSHLSDKGFYDLLEVSDKPFIASHSNARALCGHSRNLTDDMFKELVKKGGRVSGNYCVTSCKKLIP